MHKNSTEQTKILAFFTALCLFLSTIEYAIPKPLPFMRLGIANVPLILALYLFPLKHFFFLVLMKILGQALLSGTIFSYIFLFSLCGSLLGSIFMFLSHRLGKANISPLGISVAGALGNNIAQIILARYIIFGEGTKYIAPLLLITGLITGILMGIFALTFMQKSRWFTLVSLDIAHE